MKKAIFILFVFAGCFHHANEPVWHPRALEFETVPAVVEMDESLQEYYGESLYEAVKWINRVAGCPLFYLTDVGERASSVVRIVHGSVDPDHPNYAADAAIGSFYSVITVMRPLDIRLQMYVFLHELGHVAGLAHDTYGMMNWRLHSVGAGYPFSSGSDIWAPMPLTNVFFTSKDRKALNRRYCGGIGN